MDTERRGGRMDSQIPVSGNFSLEGACGKTSMGNLKCA